MSMRKIDDRIVKVHYNSKEIPPPGYTKFPWLILPHLPDAECAFDAWRGTVGFDIFPFAITTKVDCANEVFLKVYEDNNGSSTEGQVIQEDA